MAKSKQETRLNEDQSSDPNRRKRAAQKLGPGHELPETNTFVT
jgi:hypothetical protein